MTTKSLRRVVEQIAIVTRYPEGLLTANADLADDLGIDSVKNLEIVLALGQEFSLDLAAERRDPAIRTIGHVAEWIDRLQAEHTSEPVSSPMLARNDWLPSTAESLEEGWHTRQGTLPTPHFSRASDSREIHRTAAQTLLQPAATDPRATAQNAIAQSATAQSATAQSAAAQSDAAQPWVSTVNKPLAGRVALVTGSGRGVGRTIANLLASRGAHVVINSFHSRDQGDQTAADINAQGGKALHLWGSVANPNHVERIFSQIEEHFGRLDILVCNASDGRIGPFMDLTAEDWDKAFRTNVSGHHQCAVRAAQLMRATGGSIITMSAVGATRYIDGLGSQGVVKAAVESLTRYLACELGQFGIRVNCVGGGPVYGDLLSKFPAAQATQRHWEAMAPGGALTNPMDLANAIGYLVSDEASGVNGAVWMVDQGFSAVADGRLSRSRSLPTSQTVLV